MAMRKSAIQRLYEAEGDKLITKYFGPRGTSTPESLEQICKGNAYREKLLHNLKIKI